MFIKRISGTLFERDIKVFNIPGIMTLGIRLSVRLRRRVFRSVGSFHVFGKGDKILQLENRKRESAHRTHNNCFLFFRIIQKFLLARIRIDSDRMGSAVCRDCSFMANDCAQIILVYLLY